MNNSPLISGTLLTNNCTVPRVHQITRITPHYMAWYTSAKTCCESFVPASRRASANYCIGKDGEIWMNVIEANRAWTSGDYNNDHRAITIECANYVDTRDGHVYGELPKATWDSLVRLCADICLRNGIKNCTYTGNTNGTLTKHKWFQNTDCPGPWLDKQFARLATEVQELINGKKPQPVPFHFGGTYRCDVNQLHVRDAPSLSGNIVASYYKGQHVVLEDWYTSCDGFIWGRYRGATSGKLRYVAIGRDTGKVESDDYLIKVN